MAVLIQLEKRNEIKRKKKGEKNTHKSKMSKVGDGPIPAATARNLANNLYDKRKLGALEVEQLVRELHGSDNEVCTLEYRRFFVHRPVIQNVFLCKIINLI